MKKSSEFLVQFEGLKQGSHDFEWEIGKEFFEDFGEVEFSDGHFKVNMELLKQSSMLILEFNIKGSFPGSCDLCLEDISVPVDFNDRLVVKFSSEPQEATEEMVVLRHGDYEINVKQFIYEYISVALPLRRTCEDAGKTCDPQMIEKLSEFNLTEEEVSGSPEKDEENEDSTWDALKDLKNKFRNN